MDEWLDVFDTDVKKWAEKQCELVLKVGVYLYYPSLKTKTPSSPLNKLLYRLPVDRVYWEKKFDRVFYKYKDRIENRTCPQLTRLP
jgi:hypothetical protein